MKNSNGGGDMANKMPFQWYAGAGLAARLPYRKKGLFSGTQICEWPAVKAMTRAGFLIGCSLSLADKSAAENALTDAAKPKPWKSAFNDVIKELNRRADGIDTPLVTFESLFPEVTTNGHKDDLLTKEQCITSIGQRVLVGLLFGILFPKMATPMIESWTTSAGGWEDLGVGGLRANNAPPQGTTLKDACQNALSIYKAWRQI
jgi:hypothetical protein